MKFTRFENASVWVLFGLPAAAVTALMLLMFAYVPGFDLQAPASWIAGVVWAALLTWLWRRDKRRTVRPL